MRYVIVAMIVLLIAMIAGRGMMKESRFEELCTSVADAQGHGPDEGSDEWWQSCYHQVLVGTWLSPNAETGLDEGVQLHSDRTLSFVNVDAVTGDRWELTDELSLLLWSVDHDTQNLGSQEFEILNMNEVMLILKPRGAKAIISYTRESIPQ